MAVNRLLSLLCGATMAAIWINAVASSLPH
jgi:hypothetical protein